MYSEKCYECSIFVGYDAMKLESRYRLFGTRFCLLLHCSPMVYRLRVHWEC